MAIVVRNTSSVDAQDTNTASWEHARHADSDFLIVTVSIFDLGADDRPVTSVNFNTSEAFTQFASWDDADEMRVEIWYLANPTYTTANIVVLTDQGGSVAGLTCAALDCSGVNLTTPEDTSTTATGSDNDPSVSLSGAATGSLIVAAMEIDEEDLAG